MDCSKAVEPTQQPWFLELSPAAACSYLIPLQRLPWDSWEIRSALGGAVVACDA
jgi:hypothetical protein